MPGYAQVMTANLYMFAYVAIALGLVLYIVVRWVQR
jgi:hypothetical protein